MSIREDRSTGDRLNEARRELLEERLRGVSARTPLPVREITPSCHPHGRAPLSASQLQLWLVHQLAPESLAYNELITVRKVGAFDAAAFRWAFNEIIRRHEAWRTTFEMIDGDPAQVVHEHVPFELEVLDLSRMSLKEAEAQAGSIAAESTSRVYDLATGPLIRPLLVRLPEEQHRLYLGMHHLIFDGVSVYRIVLPELVSLYDARCAGETSFHVPPIQYSDYAVWEREWVESSDVERRIERCRTRMAGASPLELPLDHPRPAVPTFAGDVVPIVIESATVHSLRSIAASQNATLFQALAAAYSYWLQRYTGRTEAIFGTACDLRQRPELESMVGYCLTPVVLRGSAEGASTFTDLVREMRREVFDAIGSAVPFEYLVRHLDLPRDPRKNPVFQSVFVLEPPMLTPDPSWSIHQMENAIGALVGQSKFDISMELDERTAGHVDGRIIYSTDLFDAGTVQLMAQQFVRVLDRVAATPDIHLSDLMEPDADECRRLMADETLQMECAVDDSDKGIHQRVIAQAERTPNAVAVVVGATSMTYRQLVTRAESIAGSLEESGVRRGSVVATVLDRTIELVPSLLGVLMCGAAYVPIDSGQPVSRSRFMIEDSGASVLLTDRMPDRAMLLDGVRVVVPGAEPVPGTPRSTISFAFAPTDLAYMIYTSGTTGVPKGVQVEHHNVVGLMQAMPEALGITAKDTVLSVASYCFDMSVGDIFPTLGVGATLIMASSEQTKDPRLLIDLIARSRPTFMGATPTTWSALLGAGWSGLPTLIAGCVGEPLPEPLAQKLFTRCRGVWNGWGPTETTVFAGGGFVAPDEPITVGRPLSGVRLYVVDDRHRLVPAGVPGEILIGGYGVSRGYLNRVEESEHRYLPDPFIDGQRVFRSGDRGRLLSDGRLQHLGRNDDQVKIRGFRVELGEVESVLAQFPGVTAAAAAAREDSSGQRRLVAYVVGDCATTHDRSSTDAQLRAWVRGRLPDYMVPTAIVHLSALPTSVSGKLDRAALPAPAGRGQVPKRVRRTTVAESAPAFGASEAIAELWSEVLGTDSVDPNLNFFDQGGHSLHAARMLTQIETRLGVSITLADFLARGMTLAGLTELVTAPDTPEAAGRPRSQPQPVFVVYPNLASAMSLRHMTAVWGDEVSAHPLLPILPGGRYARWNTVEELAAPLLDAIHAAAPRGPYHLVGYSFGGLLAYELARRLSQDGTTVGLVMLDSPTPDMARELMRRWKSPSARLARVREPERTKLFREYAANLRWAAREKLIGARLVRRAEAEEFDVRGAWDIIERYSRPGHGVPMDLFVTAETESMVGRAALGWEELHQGPLVVHRMSGDHTTLLHRARAHEIAEHVSMSVQGARARQL